ncbi:imaginal disc development protein B4 isoform 1-T24 [Cochliomyia hominivorax]
MTDSLKLAEMQRTNIEFERQRHLANWLIKSSPHMATPPPPSSSTTIPSTSTTSQQHQTPNLLTATAATTAAHANSAATTNNLTSLSSSAATNPSTSLSSATNNGATLTANSVVPPTNGSVHNPANGSNHHTQQHHFNAKSHGSSGCVNTNNTSNTSNPVFYLMASNGNTGAVGGSANAISSSNVTTSSKHTGPYLGPHAHHPHSQRGLHHLAEGRKAKLRRFNSHDTSSNMFSVADFENARLARRNEIELKQRLQRRMRHGYSGGAAGGGGGSALLTGGPQGLLTGGMGDYSTGDSKASKNSNESQSEPLQVEEFLERYSLPRVVRISYKTLFSNETLQSSSSNNSSTATSSSSASVSKNAVPASSSSDANMLSSNSNSNTGTSSSSASSGLGGGGVNTNPTSQTLGSNSSNNSAGKTGTIEGNQSSNDANHNDEEQGELYLLYRLVRQRHIYHGHNAKTTTANRKKGVMIPQEFPGYFSLLNDKGLPTATLYTSLVQLVRERVCKFVSVENMPAFMESQANGSNANSPTEGCLNIYSSNANNANNRPHYVKTTARGGQVFKLLAVYEDGKQEHTAIGSTISCGGLGATKPNSGHGREKERSRYAQLLNEQRQTLYVSLATKGKFYEIELGIPQILQKRLDMSNDAGQKKINSDCVHKITSLINPSKELPMTLKYISGPTGCASAIPENICITRITTENVIIACPIEDVDMQSPLHLRKLHLTKEMQLIKNTLGFENEQRMLANPNVQNILKFCQFNCDQFLKMVEVEILQRSERSISKSRVEGLKILKPLHLPKLLRREKTTISAHEKEDSIIFLSKTDLQNLENKEQAFDQQANRISEKMKVFQSTKKKWFKKQDKNSVKSLTSLDLDVQAKKMSMERYSDMSKLLQERFGDKTATQQQEHSECASEFSAGNSDMGCSDTETTTLATINEKFNKFNSNKIMATEPNILQKSMSLQDIDVMGRQSRKPDLLASHHTTDTISEAGTDIEDMENREPLQTSFITEKLYNEFHVKTKQYSKSSSSLHQLLNFSLPQKMQIGENKRSLAQLKNQNGHHHHGNHNNNNRSFDKRLEFNIGEPVTGRRAAGGLSLLGPHTQSQNTSLISPLTPSSLIEDDLPYSSVRDSLILSSDEGSPPDVPAGTIRQALHLLDYTKENIYAEICHEASAMGGITSSHTRDTFSAATHSTQISDDYGDYASLTYPPQITSIGSGAATASSTTTATAAVTSANNLGNAISRVQINCSASPVSYHTVYLGDEPLGENYAANKDKSKQSNKQRDRSHVTTVDVGATTTANGSLGARPLSGSQSDSGGLDNIYNTLK